jgi:serine/threonine protein phosphatase 1
MYKKEIPKNKLGRDFVVGDLHGCLDLLNVLLEEVGFDKTKDRLFSVGDLVDRGPKSLQCLELLAEPWFHAVLSNHEDMMYQFFSGEEMGRYWMQNGGSWVYGNEVYVKQLCEKFVAGLPWMISVKDSFHVIHAEIDWYEPLTEETLVTKFDDICTEGSYDGPMMLWGRTLFGNLYNKTLTDRDIKKYQKTIQLHKLGQWFNADLLPIYCGHTPMTKPTKIGNLINIDTGAYRTGRLTITEPLTGKFWSSGVGETNLVTVL